MGMRTRFAACALADMGRCLAPCEGRTDPKRYGELVEGLLSSLSSPGGLLEALQMRMRALARAQRFEEAALARDRLHVLAEVLWRSRVDAWLLSGRLVLGGPSGETVALVRGSVEVEGDLADPIDTPCPSHRADELAAVRSWICRHRVTVLDCDVAPAEPVSGGGELARTLQRLRRVDQRGAR
jgi:hypothetical protein